MAESRALNKAYLQCGWWLVAWQAQSVIQKNWTGKSHRLAPVLYKVGTDWFYPCCSRWRHLFSTNESLPELLIVKPELFLYKVVQIIKCTCTVFIDNVRNISTNSLILVSVCRGSPMCDPWNSQGNEKMLFVSLFAQTFWSEMKL